MTSIESLQMIGGDICLDFANSVGWHPTEAPEEHLETYSDLLVWSRRAGVIDAAMESALAADAQARPGDAARVLEDARALREAIYRVFMSVTRGEPAPDLTAFTPFFEKALRSARLVRKGQGYDLGFEPGRTLDGMLAPIAWSAVELLRGGELDRVKTCGKESCGWLFVDRSRNRSRRWCDMSDCGNAEKARRFHQRRAGRSRPPVATKSPAQPRPPR